MQQGMHESGLEHEITQRQSMPYGDTVAAFKTLAAQSSENPGDSGNTTALRTSSR